MKKIDTEKQLAQWHKWSITIDRFNGIVTIDEKINSTLNNAIHGKVKNRLAEFAIDENTNIINELMPFLTMAFEKGIDDISIKYLNYQIKLTLHLDAVNELTIDETGIVEWLNFAIASGNW